MKNSIANKVLGAWICLGLIGLIIYLVTGFNIFQDLEGPADFLNLKNYIICGTIIALFIYAVVNSLNTWFKEKNSNIKKPDQKES